MPATRLPGEAEGKGPQAYSCEQDTTRAALRERSRVRSGQARDTTSELIGSKGARCSCRRGAAANLAATLRLTRSRRARAAPLPLLIPRARRSLCLPCRCKEKQIRWRRLLLCCGGEEVCSPIVARRYGGSGRPNTDRCTAADHDRDAASNTRHSGHANVRSHCALTVRSHPRRLSVSLRPCNMYTERCSTREVSSSSQPHSAAYPRRAILAAHPRAPRVLPPQRFLRVALSRRILLQCQSFSQRHRRNGATTRPRRATRSRPSTGRSSSSSSSPRMLF